MHSRRPPLQAAPPGITRIFNRGLGRSATVTGMNTGTLISGRWSGQRGGAACVITQVTEHAAGAPTTEGPVTGQYLLVDQEPATRVGPGRYTVDTPGGEIVTCDDPTAP